MTTVLSTDTRTSQAHGAMHCTVPCVRSHAHVRLMADAPFRHVWDRIEAARIAHPRFSDMKKWLGVIGAEKGASRSKSTWYSYQRWFYGEETKSPVTSPRVSFLSQVTALLHLRLILDVQSAKGRGARGGTREAMNDDAINTVMRLMTGITPEQRLRVRDIVIDAVAEFASTPPEGDELDGHRPSPK